MYAQRVGAAFQRVGVAYVFQRVGKHNALPYEKLKGGTLSQK